ncbi:mRNA splicing protein [Martiniozyma asiatica (nom. inval.)]|nr:mRNA splicing protein [Martiniozyma asiatica]
MMRHVLVFAKLAALVELVAIAMASKQHLPKSSKLDSLINFKVRVLAKTGSSFIGTLLSFDNHMNLVLAECEEFKQTKKSRKEVKRYLGLLIIRGENVISVVMEAAPNLATLKPQLRLNKSKGTIKPLMKKVEKPSTGTTATPAGITKAPLRKR